MDRITISQLRAEFAGGEKELRDRQPFVMFQISRARFQTESIEVLNTPLDQLHLIHITSR